MKKRNKKSINFFGLLIFSMLLCAVFSRCAAPKLTEKQRLEICNGCPLKIERHDSIVINTVTVPVNVPGAPGPTLYIDNPCKELCDSIGRLKKVNISVRHNGQTLNLNSMGGGLLINTARRDTVLPAEVKQKEVYRKEKNDRPIYVPCENERTAFDGWCRIWFYITGAAVALWLAWLYIRRKLPK